MHLHSRCFGRRVLRCSRLTLSFLALLTIHVPAVAAQEAGWQPLDRLLLRDAARGAVRITAVDAAGNRESVAVLNYDASGQLQSERYEGPDGSLRGHTEFRYEQGQLKLETLRDAHGQTAAQNEYSYRNGKLIGVLRRDGSGRLQARIEYRYRDNLLTGGAEWVGREHDEFSFEYENGRLRSIRSSTADGEMIYELELLYDSAGRISRRLRKSAAGAGRCDHSYDPRGRLLSLAYFKRTGDEWRLERRLEYSYAE
ncbi:MAG: hypothetical protein K1X75_14150 [Leptospirales bacterium]|nr:hypothetical protein [Leptospirales bacterium]